MSWNSKLYKPVEEKSTPDAKSSGKAVDPIKRLPPEVAVQCIQWMLSSGNYSSQLLDLTSVSEGWQDFLLSASILWTEIHIDWSNHDLLANIALFSHLSGTRAINLIVWDHPTAEWNSVANILPPSRQRINTLTIRSIYISSLEHPNRTSSRYIATLVKLIDCLHRPPDIRQIKFDCVLKLELSQLQSLKLPPGAQVTNPIEVPGRDVGFNRDIYDMVLHAISFEPLRSSAAELGLIGSLQILELDEPWFKGGASTVFIPVGTFPCLRDLTCYQLHNTGAGQLIQSCAVQLVRLSIQITSSQIEYLVYLLGLTVRLQELKLGIRIIPDNLPTGYVSYRPAVPSLQNLELEMFGFLEEIALDPDNPLLTLFSVFTILYPDVNRASIRGIGLRTPYVFSYLQSLSNIDYLSCRDVADGLPYTKSIILPSLSELSLDNPRVLRHMKTPNLLSLKVFNVSNSAQLRDLGLHSLLKLFLYTAEESIHSCTINPEEFPNLQELSMDFRRRPQAWTLTSFSLLVSITITSSLPYNPHGDNLCVALMYHPESCPFLRQIHFNDFVEWGILFLMLERRNFGLVGIHKIQKIILPFVPFEFRQLLTYLLEGRPVLQGQLSSLLKNSLSLEAIGDLIFDPNVLGCIRCLKYACPPCSAAPVVANEIWWKSFYLDKKTEMRNPYHPVSDMGKLFPEYPYPPNYAPAKVHLWLSLRRAAGEKWKQSFEKFRQSHYRRLRWSRLLDAQFYPVVMVIDEEISDMLGLAHKGCLASVYSGSSTTI